MVRVWGSGMDGINWTSAIGVYRSMIEFYSEMFC